MNDKDTVVVPREVIERCRAIAMRQCVEARIPECGVFSAIAQDLDAALAAAPSTSVREEVVRPFAEWHEDYGSVLWWRLPIQEPPYVGTPLDLGRAMKVVVQVGVEEHDLPATMTGGWPFDEDDETQLFWTALPDAGAIASLAALKPSTDKGGGKS